MLISIEIQTRQANLPKVSTTLNIQKDSHYHTLNCLLKLTCYSYVFRVKLRLQFIHW